MSINELLENVYWNVKHFKMNWHVFKELEHITLYKFKLFTQTSSVGSKTRLLCHEYRSSGMRTTVSNPVLILTCLRGGRGKFMGLFGSSLVV